MEGLAHFSFEHLQNILGKKNLMKIQYVGYSRHTVNVSERVNSAVGLTKKMT